MGCFNVWCPLCGGSLNGVDYFLNSENIDKDMNNIIKTKCKWLQKVTILLEDKKPKHGFVEVNCNVHFKNNKTKESYYLIFEPKLEGLAVHTDCWKYAKKNNYELLYQHFNIDKIMWKKKGKISFPTNKTYSNLKKYYSTSGFNLYALDNFDYNPILKYWGQDFDIIELQKKKKDWYILYSPLGQSEESKKNAERIPWRETSRELQQDGPCASLAPWVFPPVSFYDMNLKLREST